MSVLNTPADPRHQVPNPMASGWLRSVPLAAVILGFVLVAYSYGSLPQEIPVHFNARGEADDYGNKVILWLLPAVNLILFVVLEYAAKTPFDMFNYPVAITEENAARQHRIALQLLAYMRVVICLLLAYLVYAIVRSAQSGGSQLNMVVFWSFIVLVFAVIGWGFWRARTAR